MPDQSGGIDEKVDDALAALSNKPIFPGLRFIFVPIQHQG
jgi:hypothetical protein